MRHLRIPSEATLNQLIQGDCLEVAPTLGAFDCVFADPPDNLGLKYNEYADKLPVDHYKAFLRRCVFEFTRKAPIVWISFNSRWSAAMGRIAEEFLELNPEWQYKPCVQVFTFGQHRNEDLGNNHRPLWRFKHKNAPLYPEAIRVPSWRQRHGDKRAKAGGRVPGDVFDMQYPTGIKAAAEEIERLQGGLISPELTVEEIVEIVERHCPEGLPDVFDFPRVTGNSKQRCDWHPTQLHEDLVKRCILLSTVVGGKVLDPFAGTGTTLRVCKQTGRSCTLIELDGQYCAKISEEHSDFIEYLPAKHAA